MKESIDDLIARAENKVKRSRKYENNINTIRYIERVGWEAGETLVPTYVIYWHYRSVYDGCHQDNKARKVVFFRTFSKRFPKYRKNKQRYYLLNNVIEITEEVLKEAKAYDKNHGQRRKKKKNEIQLSGQEGNDEN